MATVPTSATQVKLLSNVPFHSDYKHTRWFDTLSSQTTFFNSREVAYQVNNFNVIKTGKEHMIKVPFNYDDIRQCNYLMFNNKNKWFYAFISHFEYSNRGSTEVYFTLDVIQTYMFDFNLKPSFIVREHQPENKKNTVKEGLDYGDAYDTLHVAKYRLNQGIRFMVIASKSPLHDSSEDDIKPSVVGLPQPLQFYIVPFLDTPDGNFNDFFTPFVRVDQATGMGDIITTPAMILQKLYDSEKAVNNIVTIYITDDVGLAFDIDTSDVTPTLNFKNTSNQIVNVVEEADKGVSLIHVEYVGRFQYKTHTAVSDYKQYFKQSFDKKLGYSPYAKIIMDDMKGNRIELDPDKINTKDLILNVKGSIGHKNHVVYGVEGYNYIKGNNIPFENELINETALVNDNPQDVAILSDHLASYMQGNNNSLKAQRNNIGFNALFGGLNTGMGVVGSVGSGNAMGTIGSIAGGIQGMGNTALQIQGLEAQLKDIETTPPQVQSMGSSVHFDFGHQYNGIYFIFKQAKSEYLRKLDDYFHMFGYKVNEVKTPELNTRQHFNYIQTTACNITGEFNNEDITEIKNVFDNGITLWHVNDVGNYNLSNPER